MTTWPTANKGSTAHTDSDDDKPRLARPEINKNISNVNDILDFFEGGSPADGDIFVYNSSNAKFEKNTSNTNWSRLQRRPSTRYLPLQVVSMLMPRRHQSTQ